MYSWVLGGAVLWFCCGQFALVVFFVVVTTISGPEFRWIQLLFVLASISANFDGFNFFSFWPPFLL